MLTDGSALPFHGGLRPISQAGFRADQCPPPMRALWASRQAPPYANGLSPPIPRIGLAQRDCGR